MADNEPTKPEVPKTEDPITRALLEAKAQAEAKKAIAEANLGTAKAMFPTAPSELPGSKLDASGAGTSFATINCYRAVVAIAERIASEVTAKPWDVIWLAPASPLQSPEAVLSEVRSALALASEELDEALKSLNVITSSGSVPQVDMAIAPPMLVAGLSALLPLIFSAFTSTNTLKGSSTDLDNVAVTNLVLRELLKSGRPVLHPDPSAGISSDLQTSLSDVETKSVTIQPSIIEASAVARSAVADAAALRDELEVRKTVLVERVKKGDTADSLKDQFDRISELGGLIAGHERRRGAAEAAVAHANAVRESVRAVVGALRLADANGVSPLVLASFGARLEEAGDKAARLEVADVSAGTESQFHDRKVLTDFAIHTGSATVSFRLVDGRGQLLATNVYVHTASSRVNLKSGEVSWAG
ncbi:MAG: hypothetical protein WCC60_03525 [Ilumatobacteraceae bacterium]